MLKKNELASYKDGVDLLNKDRTGKEQQGSSGNAGCLLFFSYDIVGSTKYKVEHPERWVQDLQVVFENIIEKVKVSPLIDATPWRMLGDEIIFVARVVNGSLAESVFNVYDILQKSIYEIQKKEIHVFLKAAAWIAVITDAKDNLKDVEENHSFDNLLFRYQIHQHPVGFMIDFIGNDIDAGFRIKQYTYSRQLVISFELAYFLCKELSNLHDDKSDDVQMILMGYRTLKGIWNGRPYPIIWYYQPRQFTGNSFEESLPYDAGYDDELINEYEHHGKEERMFSSILKKKDSKAAIRSIKALFERLSKIASDLNLNSKLGFIEQHLGKKSKLISVRDLLSNSDDMQLHLVAVCCDFKNKRVFIAKRSKNRKNFPGYWEFGCAKANKGASMEKEIQAEYESDFSLHIEVITAMDREERSPKPYALYEVPKDDGNSSDKGIILYARIMNTDIDQYDGKGDYPKHEESRLLKREQVEEFIRDNKDCLIKDFRDTILHAFNLMETRKEGKFHER